MILDTPSLPDAQLFGLLAHFKAAVVIGRKVPPEVAGSVTVDDAAGVRLALRRLVAAGRRRPAFLAGPERFASSRVRQGAFLEFERERGAFDEALLLRADATAGASYERVTQALGRGAAFDALVCFNDVMAAGALRALYDAGIGVPEQVAVVGHDDAPMAPWLHPPLSSLNIAKRDLGVTAVRLLLGRLNTPKRPPELVLQPYLTVRSSTGPLPNLLD